MIKFEQIVYSWRFYFTICIPEYEPLLTFPIISITRTTAIVVYYELRVAHMKVFDEKFL